MASTAPRISARYDPTSSTRRASRPAPACRSRRGQCRCRPIGQDQGDWPVG